MDRRRPLTDPANRYAIYHVGDGDPAARAELERLADPIDATQRLAAHVERLRREGEAGFVEWVDRRYPEAAIRREPLRPGVAGSGDRLVGGDAAPVDRLPGDDGLHAGKRLARSRWADPDHDA